jgi:hypothetical protein
MLWREVMHMARVQAANTRITVDLGNSALYRSVKVLAAYQGKPLREIVVEALKDWVDKQEELEDLRAIAEVEHEPLVPLEEAKQEWAQ